MKTGTRNGGGNLELWGKERKERVVSIAPMLNRAVIFNTTPDSLHGYPEPIRCPQHLARKSIAIYYYTIESAKQIPASCSKYYPIPGDGFAKRVFILCDNAIVGIYAWLKRTFHLSDRMASWIMKLFSR